MKRIIAVLLAALMLLAMTACSSSQPSQAPAEDAPAEDAPVEEAPVEEAKTYVVGIVQLMQHAALDSATQGFKDALVEALGDAVTFDEQNAAGDIPACGTIASSLAASNVDLILANATPALQAAASATQTIPILGTSVTEYGVALDIDGFTGTVGGNISGTSDLAPLDQTAQMLLDLVPEAETIGILYCSAEANSVYQAEVVEAYLTEAGKTVRVYTFADSNDVATVTATACADCDALYIPTDNTAASCTEAINNVADPAGIPIVGGDEGLCKGCGTATLAVDYYQLGVTTGKMAARILTGEADIAEMPIEYDPNPTRMYTASRCEARGIVIPEDYVAIAE